MSEFSDKFAALDDSIGHEPQEGLFSLPSSEKAKSEKTKSEKTTSKKKPSKSTTSKVRTSKKVSSNGSQSSRTKSSDKKRSSSQKAKSSPIKPPADQEVKAKDESKSAPAAKATPRKVGPPSATSATPPIELPLDENSDPIEPVKQGFFSNSPSWLTSLAVHLVVILILALWSLPQLPAITADLLLAEPSDSEENLDEIPEVMLDPVDLETEPVEIEMQPETEVVADTVSFSTFDEATAAPSFTELSDLALTAAPPSNPTDLVGFDGTGTTGRGRMARTALVRKHGGSQASETAVANALEWLAQHQNPDGTWSLVHTGHKCQGRCPDPANTEYSQSLRSGTGLALLPFLGAGQTHKQGRHKKTVERGLKALILMGKDEKDRPGLSWRDSGNMYAHGIAAIALTEAYGMTRDKALSLPAQAAVDYIIYAQAKDGGWRYTPGQAGDTSVTGWQIMALKSAYLSELSVPQPSVLQASKFLDSMQSAAGARYSYAMGDGGAPTRPKASMDAVGLLCRMYLGWKSDRKALQEGVAALAKRGPSQTDYYFNYYATQVLFQHTGGTGVTWRQWNRKMRDQFVEQQDKTGHAKGSWFVKGPHTERGGRIYMTSLATMSLEIYYRYMPIYKTEAVETEFPE